MKMNKWTTGLTAAGVVSLASVAQAGDANETVMTAVSSTTLSGYVSTTAIWNPGTGNAALPGGSFGPSGAEAQDGFSLDVISLSLSKALDESEWAAGYNAQLWFGQNGPQSIGGVSQVGNDGEGDSPEPGTIIKNANVDLRIPVGNGIDVKMGIFDSIIGYESTDFNANPNYSRNFGWGLEPTTHEGVLLSYNVNEMISVSAGIANANTPTLGGNGRSGYESQKSYMASVALTAPDSMGFLSGATLYAGFLDGLQGGGVADDPITGDRIAANADTTNIYVGATIPTPIEGLAVGISWDYRLENGPGSSSVAFDNGGESGAWASALAGYVSYNVTEKIAAHYRIDWAQGTDGTFSNGSRVDAMGNVTGDNNNTVDKVLSNTLTLDYKAWENVISRLELRWDHALDGQKRYGSGTAGTKNDMTVAANVIYQF